MAQINAFKTGTEATKTAYTAAEEVLRGVDLEDVGDTDLGDVLAVENPAGRGPAGLGGARGVAAVLRVSR